MQTPSDIRAEHRYLAAATVRLRSVLSERLAGVYAGGSYALGGYVPGRSDLDLAAVITEALPADLRDGVVELLRHESLPCPARALELVVYRLDTARSGSPSADFELNLNTGPGLATREQTGADAEVGAHWFAIDRSMLSQAGRALWGPPADEVFASIPPAALVPVLAESIRWHRNQDSDASDAVLNACRALRFAGEGWWSSKPAAGRWAVARGLAPEQLVEGAVRARAESVRLDADAVAEFMRTAESRLGASSG